MPIAYCIANANANANAIGMSSIFPQNKSLAAYRQLLRTMILASAAVTWMPSWLVQVPASVTMPPSCFGLSSRAAMR